MQSINKTLKRSSCQTPKSSAESSILAASSSVVTLQSTPTRSVVELSARCSQLEKELNLAANLQQDYLRSVNHNYVGVGLRSFCIPMGKTCGDALEIVRLDDDHLAILLIDATGHGLAASQLAVLAVQTIRSWLAADCHSLLSNPCDVLTKLNNLIYQANSRDCMFIAATYAVYNIRTRSVLIARGGNPYPVLYRRGSASQQIESQGPLLGVLSNACFENIELQLAPGDQLVICSDGLTDCSLADDLSLILQRAMDSIDGNELSSTTDDHLAAFDNLLTQQANAGELLDDVTVAVLQIPPVPTNDPPQSKSVEQLALA